MKSNLAASKTKILPKKSVLDLSPYGAPDEGRLNAIRLDFNENTRAVSGAYPEGMPETWISAYPEYGILLDKLARYMAVSPDSIILANGSDEAINLVANTFVEPGVDRALISSPCFVMIKQCLAIAGATLEEVPVLSNLEFDLEGIEAALDLNPRMAMFATPDNPTGSIIPTAIIEKWCQKYSDTLFVIDEAYGEFAGASVIPLVASYGNLLVLKTFSKAWAMAGLRLGMIIGSPELLQYVQRVRLPYSVNSAAVFTATRLVDREDEMVSRVAELLTERSQLAKTLSLNGYMVRETKANWCLMGAGMLAEQFMNFCRSKNILVRNRSNSMFGKFQNTPSPMWGWVRVSVGGRDEMAAFEKALSAFRDNFAIIFDLDGTLVDTSRSFDETVRYLVEKFSDVTLADGELQELRREGGFNDDWVAARELLKRRAVELELAQVADAGEQYYLKIAREKEELLVQEAVLNAIGKRNRISIVTGRTRREYAPVWGESLDPIFEKIYCSDDIDGLQSKPSPDYLNRALAESGCSFGAYVGNSVDDMRAAKSAGLLAIGIAIGADRETLEAAGADVVLESCSQLTELLMLPDE